MRRIKSSSVVVILLAAACSPQADQVSSSTLAAVEQPSTSTTTIVETTTSSPESLGTPKVLGRRGATSGRTSLAPGVFRHDLSVVPVDFTLESEGWQIVIVADRFVAFGHKDAPMAPFLTFKPVDGVDELVDEITGHPEAVEFTVPLQAMVGGLEGVGFDVLFGESPIGRGGPFPCNGPPLSEELAIDGGSVGSFIVGCSWNRFWIGDLGQGSVVVHVGNIEGSPETTAGVEGFALLIDEFLAAISFGES